MNGTIITINFVNFIKQLSLTKVFGLIFETLQPAQGIVFSDLLDTITSNTLAGGKKAASTVFSFDTFQGLGEFSDLVLKDSTVVYVTISSFMTIFQVLNKILYPYQRLNMHKDSMGNIAIAPLSLFDDFQWFFAQSNFSPGGVTTPYLNISIKKNAAGIPNYEYATLFTIPTAQGLLGGDQKSIK